MTSSRERAVGAAVRLVGTRGVRALSHARVDAEAGLPRGSTSNYFRTRSALVSGVFAWIAEREREDLAAIPAPPHSVAEVAEAFCDLFEDFTGRHAVRTRARYALFLEMAADPEVQAPLRRQRTEFATWTRDQLTGLGARDPDAATRIFLAFGAGLIINRLTVDPDAPLRPTVAIALAACLAADPPA